MARHEYDVLIAGAGPAGSACAAACARAGLRVLVIERAYFPREKVCGDCLNPDCWPVLERLGAAAAVRALPPVRLEAVEFISARGSRLLLPLPTTGNGEVTIKRSALDDLLARNAVAAGAEIIHGAAVTGVRRLSSGGFSIEEASAAGNAVIPRRWRGRVLVAADGRNSVVARGLGILAPGGPPRRVGLQTHAPCPPDFGRRVQMRWFAEGYGGLAPVGERELNLSLAGPPAALEHYKRWAQTEFGLDPKWPWRTIAPLDRPPAVRVAHGGAFLVGDAARVVEPFTGEGIYYALRSGELAGEAIVRGFEHDPAWADADYRRRHAAMYRGRLWVNRLARAAALHPRLAAVMLEAGRRQPALMRLLTAKVVAR